MFEKTNPNFFPFHVTNSSVDSNEPVIQDPTVTRALALMI